MFLYASGFYTALFFWNLEDENFGRAFFDMLCAIFCLCVAGN